MNPALAICYIISSKLISTRREALEAARRACQLTVIGEAVEEGIWMERYGEKRQVEARGYEHRIGERYG